MAKWRWVISGLMPKCHIINSSTIHHCPTQISPIMASQISIDSERQEEFAQITAIPEDVKPLLPLQTDPISSLISWDHPCRISLLFDWVWLPEPVSSSCLLAGQLHISQIVQYCHRSGSRILDSSWKCNFVRNSHPPPWNTQLILPLWGVTFWKSALHVMTKKGKWIKLQKWLTTEAEQGIGDRYHGGACNAYTVGYDNMAYHWVYISFDPPHRPAVPCLAAWEALRPLHKVLYHAHQPECKWVVDKRNIPLHPPERDLTALCGGLTRLVDHSLLWIVWKPGQISYDQVAGGQLLMWHLCAEYHWACHTQCSSFHKLGLKSPLC